MAKELPYFKFEPAAWSTGDVSFLSMQLQGYFLNVCCLYWQRLGELTFKQVERRLSNTIDLQTLLKEGVIKKEGEKLVIEFLDSQLSDFQNIREVNIANGKKGGRPRKTETKPIALISETENKTETKGIREEEIREEEKKEPVFNFRKELLKLGGTIYLVDDWIKVRKSKKSVNTETALKGFISQLEKSGRNINEVLELCVSKSWAGFNSEWVKSNNTEPVITKEDLEKHRRVSL